MYAKFSILSLLFVMAACSAAQTPAPDNVERPADPLAHVSAQELFRRGRLLLEAEDYVRAEHYLNAAVARGFPEEQALPVLITVCIRGSRLVAALNYAEPLLAEHPMNWTLRLLVASLRIGLEQHQAAHRELLRVLDTAPEEPAEAHYLLAILYRDHFRAEDRSVDHFRRYLAIAPEGSHAEEAIVALPRDERPGPRRIRREEQPDQQTAEHEVPSETQTATPDGGEP